MIEELLSSLYKRIKYGSIIVIIFAIAVFVYDYIYGVNAPQYYNGVYNMYVVYFLIIYKLLELPILYYLFFKRNVVKLHKNLTQKEFKKIAKKIKVLFFLIPQGNIVFGIIAYKFSENIFYFLLFSCIAIITFVLIKLISLKKIEQNDLVSQF